MRRYLAWLVILIFLTVSACDTAEERAEKHFQNALALLEEGDQDRAIIEFRNVFKLNGTHQEARRAYAELQHDRGNLREAASQYLRLVEQYPDDFDAQLALAELLAELGSWPQLEPAANAAFRLQPENLRAQAVKAILDYQQGRQHKDDLAAAQAVEKARSLIEKLPDYATLRLLIIDDHIRQQRFGTALEEIDAALEVGPTNRQLNALRLNVLGTLGDKEGIEQHLIAMTERFPEDDAIRASLVRFLISEDRIDSAEEYLRKAISETDDTLAGQLVLLNFIRQMRGADAALAEAEALLAAGNDAPVLKGLRATLLFDQGAQQDGIREIQDTLAAMEPGDDANNLRVGLAAMLLQTGNEEGARKEVETVLEADAGHVAALKMRADWQIADDQVGEAITTLRAALDQNPSDAEIMSLMARAYERAGNAELMGEMLSLAVETSDKAPAESLRYAKFLVGRERYSPAESVLVAALRLAPGQVDLLSALGEIYVATKDWPRAEQVIGTLRRLDEPRAETVANAMTAKVLQAQQNNNEAMAFLQNLIDEGDSRLGPTLALVRAHLANGEAAKARDLLNTLLADDGANTDLKFLLGSVEASDDNPDRAEEIFRELTISAPEEARGWIALVRLKNRQGLPDDAGKVLDAALDANPDSATLLWAKASQLENQGDIDGAIAVYEELYAKNSSNVIVANNLASLLSSYYSDDQTLERAYIISRRLRPLPQAAFKDTWGWIAFLRGETEEALPALEVAASRLTNDPLVQYHLGRVYAALERNDQALEQYLKTIELTTEADTREFVQHARTEIARLQSPGGQ